MKNKSNTHAIIKIWMKACFEKLMDPEKATLGPDPSAPSTLAKVSTEPDCRAAKLSPKTRQDT